MATVRSAIHVRTGQRAVSAAIDDWLARNAVAVTGFADVYDACLYLLRQYERIPDLALLGADWLADDELPLIAYLRQTWPRTVMVVYGGATAPVRVDLLPLTVTVYGPAALDTLLADTPADLVGRHLSERPSGVEQRTPPAGSPHRPVPNGPRLPVLGLDSVCGAAAPGDSPSDLELPRFEWPRSILTAEELAALLDRRPEH